MRGKLKREYWVIKFSRLFDENWYLKQYPDVRSARMDPIEHYVLHGWREGRNPAPWFNTSFYLQNNPDVAKKGINPFFHWIKWGQHENRKPNPNWKAQPQEDRRSDSSSKKSPLQIGLFLNPSRSSKPNLVLHIGYPKTGSTSIQTFLSNHREFLLKHGYLYPVAGTGGEVNHFHLSVVYQPKSDPFYSHLKLDKKALLKELTEEIQRYIDRVHTVIISSEMFSSYEWEPTREFLKDIHDMFNKIYLVFSLRRQDQLIETEYQERVKSELYNNFEIIESQVAQSLNRIYKYGEVIERFLDRISREGIDNVALKPLIFNKGENMVSKFLKLSLNFRKEIIDNLQLNLRTNPSLSFEGVEALKILNEKYLFEINESSMNLKRELVKLQYRLDDKLGKLRSAFLPLGLRLKILKYYEESNKKLFSEILKTQNLFELTSEEIKRYQKQEEVPQEVILKAINGRYQASEEFIKNSSITPPLREKVYLNQRYGYFSDVLGELIKSGYVKSGVWGYLEVINEREISGWLLDLETDEPATFSIKVNGQNIYEGVPDLPRPDIERLSGRKVKAGFSLKLDQLDAFQKFLSLKPTNLEIEVIHNRTGYLIPKIPEMAQ